MPLACRLAGRNAQIRAEAEADARALVDLFIDVVKAEVPDEEMRDRIARALVQDA